MKDPLTLQIILGVVVIFYFVCAYFSAKTWRIPQVLMMVFVFLASLAFCAMIAFTLKTHKTWMEKANELRAGIDKAGADAEFLVRGMALDAAGKAVTQVATDSGELLSAEETIPVLKAKLQNEVLGRGRVWRRLVPENAAQFDGNTVVLNHEGWTESPCDLPPHKAPPTQPGTAPVPGGPATPAPGGGPMPPAGGPMPPAGGPMPPAGGPMPPAGPGPVPAPVAVANRPKPFGQRQRPGDPAATVSDKGLVVRAFRQGAYNYEWSPNVNLTCTKPVEYLGEFKIEDFNDKTVTLVAVDPMDADQLAKIRQGGSWVLYENMPINSYDTYKDLTREQIDEIFTGVYGSTYLKQMKQREPEQYKALLDEYANPRRVLTAEEAAKVPDSRKFVKVSFVENLPSDKLPGVPGVPVDVDSETAKQFEKQFVKGYFDRSGQARKPLLMKGGVQTFQIGDEATLPAPATFKIVDDDGNVTGEVENLTKRLLDAKIITINETFYRRPLRDYATIFDKLRHQEFYYVRQAETLEATEGTLNTAAAILDAQLKGDTSDPQSIVVGKLEIRNKLIADLLGYQAERDALLQKKAELEAELNRLVGTPERPGLIRSYYAYVLYYADLLTKAHEKVLAQAPEDQRLPPEAPVGPGVGGSVRTVPLEQPQEAGSGP